MNPLPQKLRKTPVSREGFLGGLGVLASPCFCNLSRVRLPPWVAAVISRKDAQHLKDFLAVLASWRALALAACPEECAYPWGSSSVGRRGHLSQRRQARKGFLGGLGVLANPCFCSLSGVRLPWGSSSLGQSSSLARTPSIQRISWRSWRLSEPLLLQRVQSPPTPLGRGGRLSQRHQAPKGFLSGLRAFARNVRSRGAYLVSASSIHGGVASIKRPSSGSASSICSFIFQAISR